MYKPLNTMKSSGQIVLLAERQTRVMNVFENEIVSPSGNIKTDYIDVDGFNKIYINAMQDVDTISYIQLTWSYDKVNEAYYDYLIEDNKVLKNVSCEVKAPYVKIEVGHYGEVEMSVLCQAYLKV